MVQKLERVRGVLQAGGRGARMGPTATELPKPLIEIAGVPLVERLLRQFVEAGVLEVTVITGFMGEKIERHLSSLGDLPDALRLEFLRETEPRGNVGALAGLPRDGKTVLLAFGDLLTDLDFASFCERHRREFGDVTLTSHLEGHRLRLGELEVEGTRVTGYREKPTKQFLICSGIALLEPSAIDLVPADRPVGISDLVSAALANDLQVSHWSHGAFWRDINSPDELVEAERAWSEREEPLR